VVSVSGLTAEESDLSDLETNLTGTRKQNWRNAKRHRQNKKEKQS